MNVEKYNELTDKIADDINYDFFSKEAIKNRLELKKKYCGLFTDAEILKIEVVRAAINKLPLAELIEVFENVGLDSNDISTMKRIYDKPFYMVL